MDADIVFTRSMQKMQKKVKINTKHLWFESFIKPNRRLTCRYKYIYVFINNSSTKKLIMIGRTRLIWVNDIPSTKCFINKLYIMINISSIHKYFNLNYVHVSFYMSFTKEHIQFSFSSAFWVNYRWHWNLYIITCNVI